MVRLKHFGMYKMSEIPDHLHHEVIQLSKDLSNAAAPICEGRASNVLMAASNFFQAALIFNLVVEEEEHIEKAAQLSAQALYENIKYLWELKKNDQLKR